jgi:hypothetical protein
VGAALTTQPVLAQQVGTTTAANPSSEGTPPGGSTVALTVGARVVHKEHIHTTPSGSVQLLFLDKSTLSIAPNTNIVIDEFVYDPNSGNGHILVKLTEGALRYVGGQLSHEGEATISTPSATIGIRGGTVITDVGPNGTTVIDGYGTITISNNTGIITLTHQGSTVTVKGLNIPIGQPAQVTAYQVTHYIKYIMSQFGQTGGTNGFNNIQTAVCGTPTTLACPQPPWIQTGTGEWDALQIIVQGTQLGSGQTPPQHHSFSP